jgi:hypothetical protein
MTTRLRSFLPPIGLSVLAIVAIACDVKVNEKGGVSLDIVEGKAEDDWTRTYTLSKDGQLEIVNEAGEIDVVPATGADVEVRVHREAHARTDEAAQQMLQELRIDEEVAPNRVKIEASRTGRPGGFRQGIRLRYRVSLPAGLRVSLKTENGNVRLNDVNGRFTAGSTNGNVLGRGVGGSIEGTTVNGMIQMDLTSVAGDIRLSTVNGGIRINVPPDVNATLDARTVNGGVRVSDDLPMKATLRERLHVSGDINAGGPTIDLQATNGPIVLGVRGNEAAEVEERRERGGR